MRDLKSVYEFAQEQLSRNSGLQAKTQYQIKEFNDIKKAEIKAYKQDAEKISRLFKKSNSRTYAICGIALIIVVIIVVFAMTSKQNNEPTKQEINTSEDNKQNKFIQKDDVADKDVTHNPDNEKTSEELKNQEDISESEKVDNIDETEEKKDEEMVNNTDAEQSIKIGAIVLFTGNKHYRSSYTNAVVSKCIGGKAKVTDINLGAKHPYHLVTVEGECTVYGWVDEKDISLEE